MTCERSCEKTIETNPGGLCRRSVEATLAPKTREPPGWVLFAAGIVMLLPQSGGLKVRLPCDTGK